MAAVHPLEQWREFYVLLGTAGATLVALLFVAVSLGSGYLTESRAAGTREGRGEQGGEVHADDDEGPDPEHVVQPEAAGQDAAEEPEIAIH